MGKSSSCLVAVLAVCASAPSASLAQAKIRVAIWELENHADTGHWYSKDLGSAARNQIDTQFSSPSMCFPALAAAG